MSDFDSSDSDAGSNDFKSEERTWFGIKVKSSYGFTQWFVIPFLSCGTVIVGVYMNTQLTYMLQSESMFNIPGDEIGQVTSDLTIYSLPFSMVTTFFVSYLYEILGRKITLFMSFFLTSIIFYILPYTAPNFTYLIIARCLIGVTMSAPLSHPLIADYIHKKSRGKAIALSGIGFVIGEVLAMGALLQFTKSLSYEDAFAITAFIVLIISIVLLYSVKDPDMKKLRNKIDLKIKNSPVKQSEEDKVRV